MIPCIGVQASESIYGEAEREFAIESEFAYAKSFNAHGLAEVGIDSDGDGIIEPGIINTSGERVFGFDGTMVHLCPNGLIMVLGENNMIAFFDKDGKQLTDYVYDAYVDVHPKTGEKNYSYFNTDAGDGKSDLVRVSRNYKFGYINSKGEEVIEPQYEYVYGFYNGVSRTGALGILSAYGTYINAKFGYIDESGKTLFAPDALWAASDFTSDFVTIADGEKKTINKNGSVFDINLGDYTILRANNKLLVGYSESAYSFCLFDFSGKELYPATYEDIILFGDFAVVGGKKIVDQKGKVVREFGEDVTLGMWTDNKSFLKITKTVGDYDNRYGYINMQGEIVFEPVYKNLRELGENVVFAVRENNERWLYDYKGNPILNLNGEVGYERFSNGLLPILDYDTMKYGYIKNPIAQASDWAIDEVTEARDKNLIPESILGNDFKENMTREEFASVCVKLYEKMQGKEIAPLLPNPFSDTENEDVIKAYSQGIVKGVSETEFAPNDSLTREQAATMLSRAFGLYSGKDIVTAGPPSAKTPLYYMIQRSKGDWSEYGGPTLFADDEFISDWAYYSVYFMNKNGIVKGVGDEMFAPQSTLTREQAVLMALRLWNLV